MKVLPTLEGGLRLDAEDADDWEMLRGILRDVDGCAEDLADRLGGMISEEAGAEDWQEYIVPDLREAFNDEVAQVGVAIETAAHASGGGAGALWIKREDADAWYSALNQARLALEEIHHFGNREDLQPAELPPPRRAAFFRSQFYRAIQCLMLEHVMGG